MSNIILVGGKTPSILDNTIEDYIISRVTEPKILFFPTASLDSSKTINNLKNQFKEVSSRFMLLYSNPTKEEIDNNLAWANILYFAGGNTINLVNKIKEYNIDEFLRKTDKLIVGVSAGAIMVSKYGMGDSYSYLDNGHTYNFQMVEGIGLLDVILCPHYDNDDLVVFNDEIRKYKMNAIALENDTALHINENKINVIKAFNNKSIYVWRKENNYIMESLYNKKKIASLGPSGTYCSLATNRFIQKINTNYDIEYYPTIRKTIAGLEENDLAIIPFENTLDGYVLDSIDTLMKANYHIIADIEEKVEFAFVSNDELKDIKNVYVQFKAKAECLEFLTVKNNFNLITTDNNIESLNRLEDSGESYGAIIPLHKLKDTNFKTVIKNVDDRENNYTRFIVLSKDDKNNFYKEKIKCSLGVYMDEDRPGLLFEFLKKFNDYGLNLNAILSRPTKEGLGKYNFYMEIMAYKNNIDSIINCINELSNGVYRVKNLGIYSSIL
ncbi:MAG: prephenate dehydratase domain-containing protein [Anaeroplasmataceae bacterium]